MPDSPALQIDLAPIIEKTVETVLARIERKNEAFGTRIAFSEAEAAALLGVPKHVLRDCRQRGDIKARKVGKEFRYSRASLLSFMGEGAE